MRKDEWKVSVAVIPNPEQAAPSSNSIGDTESVLDDTIGTLQDGFPPTQLATALCEFGRLATTLTLVQRAIARNAAIGRLETLNVRSPAKMVDAALEQFGYPQTGQHDGVPDAAADSDPWADPVDGAELLDNLEDWFRSYVHLPAHAPAAIAGWTIATWLVDVVYFAPLLVILSATKQCGKTLLLDLLKQVTRRASPTSGVGITSAVVFRLNQLRHPTFLVDEAEKLGGRNANHELIGLFNAGYRRGSRVQRCADRSGEIVVEDFDAFGFRALAAIGNVWDTLLDRAIVLRLERKPRDMDVARFSERQVAKEGLVYARQLRRWAGDNADEIRRAELEAPRPRWLGHRECDNWCTIFAVAAVVGGRWPGAMLEAARALQVTADDEGDHAERLIHDVRRVFDEANEPEVMKSGDLVKRLNEIETSPWGDLRHGDGLTPHKLASLLKPFGVRSRKRRPRGAETVRGYWLQTFQDVFARYPLRESVPSVTSQEQSGIHQTQRVPPQVFRDTSGVPLSDERDTSDRPKPQQEWATGHSGHFGTAAGSIVGYEGEERLAIQEEQSQSCQPSRRENRTRE